MDVLVTALAGRAASERGSIPTHVHAFLTYTHTGTSEGQRLSLDGYGRGPYQVI